MTERQSKTQVKRSRKSWLIAGSLIGLAITASVFFTTRQSESEPAAENSVTIEPAAEVVEADAEEMVVDDDGRSLWVSPTAGAPISLSYLPRGTQLVLHVRPADLLAHAEGEKNLAALGPWGEEAVAYIEQQTGVPLVDVETLVVAVHATLSGELRTTWRLELVKPASDRQTFNYGDRVCFFPAVERGKVLVSCLAEDVAELTEQGSAPALFPRDMQRLVDRTDEQRMATLVFSPRFLQTDGHKLLSGGAKRLEEVLTEMVGTSATAVALSAHWGDNFFLELQSTVTLDLPPHRFGSNVQQWLPYAVDVLESTIRDDDYGREIIERFPAMLRYLSRHTRSEEVDGVSVLRCYLPTVAGHNLLMAAELVLNQFESSAQTDGTEIAPPQTVEEKLLQVTSLSFPKETLERALEILAEDLGVKIEIAGRDLQLEGITKNQSFGVNLWDKPAGEILLAVLRLANPDRTAVGLADAKQKLVYVLREDANGHLGVIVVTTRAAATRRGELLPEAFLRESAQE